ncbi:hypothetical protein HKX48_004210, partial [Thoreauomyces humboldtii]
AIGTRREWSDEGGSGVNERVLSTLLNEMDGVQERQGVFIVSCTTRPDKIDDALLRPGRLDHHLYVGLPTLTDRRDILDRLTAGKDDSIRGEDVNLDRLADRTEGFTGADLSVLVRESGIQALRQDPEATVILQRHVDAALDGAIRSNFGEDPFAAVLLVDEEDEEEHDQASGEPTAVGWWRPAWIGQEDLEVFQRFRRGREAS